MMFLTPNADVVGRDPRIEEDALTLCSSVVITD